MRNGVENQPVNNVLWIPIEKIKQNAYNPNSVAPNEMKLLYTSIWSDGYTQPVVVVEDDENPGNYIIVDGFHRYTIMKMYEDVRASTDGLLPVVIIKGKKNNLMAATVRHNRARGKHAVGGMSEMVFEMLDNGWKDEEIVSELGMEKDELLRLKHVTGFSKLFEDVEYRRAWETRAQIKAKKAYEERKSLGTAFTDPHWKRAKEYRESVEKDSD